MDGDSKIPYVAFRPNPFRPSRRLSEKRGGERKGKEQWRIYQCIVFVFGLII